MGRLRRRLAGLKSAETPQEESSDERLLFWSLWNPDCPQAVGQMKRLGASAMHDCQVVSPQNPNQKKKQHQRLRVVRFVELEREEILEGIESETWEDRRDGRLEELGIEEEILIEIEKQVRSEILKLIQNEIEKQDWNEIEKQSLNEIEKQILSARVISESESMLEPSLGAEAERAIPNHPRPKMKKSLKALWSAWT